MQFKLYFFNNALFRMSFTHQKTVTLVRGKSENKYNETGCVQWTSAVKAFCELLLSYHLVGKNNLTGVRGSSSSSLDYALSKPPTWLCDLFYIENNDLSLLRRLFHRVNAEGKCSGPTQVIINTNLLSRDDIQIYIGSNLATDGEKRSILNCLFDRVGKKVPLSLLDIYSAEADLAICDQDLFLTDSYNKKIKSLVYSQSVKAITKRVSCFETLVNNRVAKKYIPYSKIPDLEIALPYTQAGTLAIFNHLSSSYDMKINYQFLYAVPIANTIINLGYEPDICCLGWPPAIKLLKKSKDYLPLSLGPRVSHEILFSKNNRDRNLSMICDEPNTCTVCFDQLLTNGKLSKHMRVKNCEPDEAYLLAKSNNLSNALTLFPYYKLLNLDQKLSSLGSSEEFFQYSLILLHRKHIHLFDKLRLLINNSWAELTDATNLRQVVGNYLDSNFIDNFQSYSLQNKNNSYFDYFS